MTRLLLLALLLLASPWLRAADDELLEPEKAFRFSAEVVKPDMIEGQFRVAKGYYLYQNKLKFSAQGARLGKPTLPTGKSKEDETFGKVDVYTHDFRVRIPVSATKPFTRQPRFRAAPKSVSVTRQGHFDNPATADPGREGRERSHKRQGPDQVEAKSETKPETTTEPKPAAKATPPAPASTAAAAGQSQSPELIARQATGRRCHPGGTRIPAAGRSLQARLDRQPGRHAPGELQHRPRALSLPRQTQVERHDAGRRPGGAAATATCR